MEGRGLGSGSASRQQEPGDWHELRPPEKVGKLQSALHAKAKEGPSYRFYALYDKANYFRLGPVSRAYAVVDRHARRRLRQWLRRKHKIRGRGASRYPDRYLEEELGLTRLTVRTRSFPWAKA